MKFSLLSSLGSPHCVVLADGQFPSASEPLALLRQASFVCCCDGASRHLLSSPQAFPPAVSQALGGGGGPLAIVGDGDSVPPSLRPLLRRVAEQDDNDLTKATRHVVGLGHRSLVYLGATGGREDHTLGNISLLLRYAADFGLEPLMATDHGWFVVAGRHGLRATHVFESFAGQQVSIFNAGCTQLSSEGLRWPSRPYASWWEGTLNEALARSFSLTADGPLLVYRTYQPKTIPKTI